MIFSAIPFDLVRGLHILSVIAWMAGMLMLPRFYVYQTGSEPGGELERKMIEAAARLRTIIMTPAMIAAWTFGLIMLTIYDRVFLATPWLIAKLGLVIALSGLHGFYVSEGRRLAKGERRRTERFWRMMNELPFVIAIAVVLLATIKPMLPISP